MKTPEEIAVEITIHEFPPSERGAVQLAIVKAIEADRALREFPMSDPVIELREWAGTVSLFMAEDKSNDWREEIAQLEAIEERLDGMER